jgi:aspartate/methionine/tyrosine aminotransferase
VTAFPRLNGLEDTEPLCHHLAERHRILLVPGSCFGAPAHVRLGFGGASEDLLRGLGHLSEALAETEEARVSWL